jgi:hypothetical protein
VGPVHRAEGVVDVHVAELGELRAKASSSFSSSSWKRRFSSKQSCPAAQIVDHLLRRVADAVLGQQHLVAGELGEASRRTTSSERLALAGLRPAHVRGEDHLRAGIHRELDGGQRLADARIVGDRARLLVEGTLKSTRMKTRLPWSAPPSPGRAPCRAPSIDLMPGLGLA